MGTGVVKLPGLHVGRTGLTQQQAEAAGYEVVTVLVPTDDKAHYYPGAGFFITKLIAEKETHKLLGVQVLGTGAVDKMVDIAVMGLNMGAVLEDFENADFAYAPPFSTAIHPFVQAKSKGWIKKKNCFWYVRKENVPISCRTVCVSMDIKILWFWKGQRSLTM